MPGGDVPSGPNLITSDKAEAGGGAVLAGHPLTQTPGGPGWREDRCPVRSTRPNPVRRRVRPADDPRPRYGRCRHQPPFEEHAMSTTQNAASNDERIKAESPFSRLMKRPELGAIAGGGAGHRLLRLHRRQLDVHPGGGFMNFMSPAAQLGILAIGAALLMIGGEFDPLPRLDDRLHGALLRRLRGDLRAAADPRHPGDAPVRGRGRGDQRSDRAGHGTALVHRDPRLPVHLPRALAGGAQVGGPVARPSCAACARRPRTTFSPRSSAGDAFPGLFAALAEMGLVDTLQQRAAEGAGDSGRDPVVHRDRAGGDLRASSRPRSATGSLPPAAMRTRPPIPGCR